MNTTACWLGKLIGIGVVACILTAIPMVVGSLIGKPLKRPQIVATFVVAVILCIGASLIVALSTPRAWGESETVFAPRISDYAVTFSGKPTIKEFDTVTAEGETIRGVRAEFRAPDSFQRVEVIAMSPGFSSGETRESAIVKMAQYAQHNGLSAPEFTWEVTPIGKLLSMRATKILDDNGKARAVTYEAVVYYGHSSLFTAYVGGPSESYPPTRVVKFLKSVKKKEKD